VAALGLLRLGLVALHHFRPESVGDGEGDDGYDFMAMSNGSMVLRVQLGEDGWLSAIPFTGLWRLPMA